ncbi:MAG: hypothetical protein KJ787_09995 [Gammaproteobacteria bacterium]|nr:hypothetical protein [Gammaproteobacteria bacterium]MBU1646652.1 hypothetical protein [Gammaproteobacteria bacterium]MBU1972909.1 hypothetical protein [Gammaproteobacteria bacterium]
MAWSSSFSSALLAALMLMVPLSQAQDATAIRGTVVAPLQEAPADVVAATLSVVAALRGLKDPARFKPVEFTAGAMKNISDPHTRFDGFDVAGLYLGYLGPSASGQPGRRIVGTLAFVDGAGRRAEETIALDYLVKADGLLVREAAVARQAPLRPRVVLYRLPASRMPADFLAQIKPFGETLDWLARNAVTAASEAAAGEPFFVFAVSMDRLEHHDRLILDADGRIEQTLLDIGGWQMVVSRIEPGADAPMTLRVNYRSARLGRVIENLATLPTRRR